MFKTTTRLPKPSRWIHRCYSSTIAGPRAPLPKINTLSCDLDDVPLDQFRETAFVPGKPVYIAPNTSKSTQRICFPAQEKWFDEDMEYYDTPPTPSHTYLSQFADTILPYELILNPNHPFIPEPQSHWSDIFFQPIIPMMSDTFRPGIFDNTPQLHQLAAWLRERQPHKVFHRFDAPLSLFLEAYRFIGMLYIAQAQIADLPRQLQDDLPVPRIVREAGKGDIYDANIWMGVPPTYTPLHKDPNPNLFVQLAGKKVVRLFEPEVGLRMYRDMRKEIGKQSWLEAWAIRGEEMMVGPERELLHKVVWNEETKGKEFEVTVGPGEALFIPKGWWHSIKSTNCYAGVNLSVNWWFR